MWSQRHLATCRRNRRCNLICIKYCQEENESTHVALEFWPHLFGLHIEIHQPHPFTHMDTRGKKCIRQFRHFVQNRKCTRAFTGAKIIWQRAERDERISRECDRCEDVRDFLCVSAMSCQSAAGIRSRREMRAVAKWPLGERATRASFRCQITFKTFSLLTKGLLAQKAYTLQGMWFVDQRLRAAISEKKILWTKYQTIKTTKTLYKIEQRLRIDKTSKL
jgi:hypothetical protein